MDRNKVRELRTVLEAALKDIAPGLIVSVGNATFSVSDVTFKVKVVEAGNPEEALKVEWAKSCRFFGLTPEDFGCTVLVGATPYTLVKINSRSPKNPFIGKRADGKMFKLGYWVVQPMLDARNRKVA